MNLEILGLVFNNMELMLGTFFMFALAMALATFILTIIPYKLLSIPLAGLIVILLAHGQYTRFLVPEYQKQEQVWKKDQAKKELEAKIAATPWTTISYGTKVVTLDYRQQAVLFQFYDTVEFMDQQGYVYNRSISMNEGPWRQVQMSLYHNLLKLKETEEYVEITYDTKEGIDPSSQRVIKTIKTLDGKTTLWSAK